MVSDRIRILAQQPFIRPGQVDFDCAYAAAIMDARGMVRLEREILKDPGAAVTIHGSTGTMGYVPPLGEGDF